MKAKLTFSFFFSLCSLAISAQMAEPVEKSGWKYSPNFVVGVDVLGAGLSFFGDRKVFQGFVSSRLKKELHAVADAGFEKNSYVKNGYDAEASGPFIKLGTLYRLMKDPENALNGFYVGGKAAASFYRQEYRSVPVRGFGGSSSSVAFPPSSQSSYWIEGYAGGRVQLFDSNFYIDVNVQPKYVLYSTTQENIKPMIIPGFGRSSGKFNVGYMWNIAYSF